MPTIEIDGASAFYGTGGADWQQGRPCVVLLHGAGMDHSVWALQARSLARHGWNVAAPDLPGHGSSDDVEGITRIEHYAAWTASLVRALTPEPVALVGHSMGACIGLTLAATQPDLTLAVALVGSGTAMPVNDALLHDTANAPGRAHRFIAAFGHDRGSHFGGAQAPGVWLLGNAIALLERCDPAVLHRDFSACNAWNGADLPAAIKSPALVLAADGDRMTPPAAGRKLAESIEGARYRQIPNAGHMMMSEAPTATTRTLREFLAPLAS
jgi:pimeloyl-ACP methyl ester carboxylesterase